MIDSGQRHSTPHPTLIFENPQPGFQSISTCNERADRRFDYWRSLHPNVDLNPIEKAARDDFRANLLHYAAADGTTFGVASNDDVVARFAKPNREFVIFSLTLSGSAKFKQDNDTEHVASPRNGFVALDATRPFTSVSERHEHLYLTVPRAKITDALGGAILPGGFLMLPSNGVAQLLKSHLLMTAKEARRLNVDAAAAAVRCGVDLALQTLAQRHNRNGHASTKGPGGALYAAACRYIDLHFGDSALTGALVSRAVGCSRAHLNRIFAEHGEQAGETIRRTRLKAACRLLASSMTLPIEQVARSCGFDNPSSFTRAFRDFAGMTPSAYREMQAQAAGPDR